MKKILCFVLTLTIMFCLCSCGRLMNLNKPQEESETVSSQVDKKAETVISLNTYEISTTVGSSYQLKADAADGIILKWKSSNEDVALVNSNGLVTTIGEGVTNITCYADGAADAVCTITVEPKTETASSSASSTYNPTYNNDDFIFPNSSYEYLTEAEIANKIYSISRYSPTGSYAQDAINEIYARNGYVFKKKNTSSYYNSQSWYVPDPSFSTADFNKYETKNIALLKKFL